MTDVDQRLEILGKEVERLQRVNEVLMRKIEHTVDLQGSNYSIFQAASELEDRVRERTDELQQTLERLELANGDLIRAKTGAEAASRAKSAFLANMSHEIRTPMNGVLGMTEILLSSELDSQQLQSVETIQKSASSLLAILDDILDVSKIEAGRLDLEKIPFDPTVAIEESVGLLAEQAHSRGLDLILDLDLDLPRSVEGDPLRLRQVLTNLVGNAIKFTEHGHICVEARQDAGVLRMAVEDTGIGLDDQALSRVFKSFAQADSSTTRRFGGTGLGLCIAKQLCEMMGGDLTVTSEPGRGSRFEFTLRLNILEDAPQDHRISPAPNFTIGFATANARLAEVAGRMFDRLGVQHRLVDPSEGLGGCTKGACGTLDCHPVIFVDERLPAADQAALLGEGEQPVKHRRAILLGRPRSEAASSDALQRDYDDVVLKPVSLRSLREAVERAMQNSCLSFPAPAAPAKPRRKREQLGTHVLMAEDNPVNQQVAKGMLKLLGCTFDIVGDGLQALDALELSDYDLVLMDCHMPVCDGFEATTRIREGERERGVDVGIPVVAVTASAMSEDRERCASVGMNDVLTKPYRLDDLKRMIQDHALKSAASPGS